MIAVPTLLVASKWQAKSNRYQRVARFVDYLFSRIDSQQALSFDPKWKSINLAATVPGLTRLSAAQDDSNVWRICHIRSRRRLARQLGGVSDTTSPADYTPIMSASTASRGGSDGSSMQLSTHCRPPSRNTAMPARQFLGDVPACIFR
jgi:hypothetical protein